MSTPPPTWPPPPSGSGPLPGAAGSGNATMILVLGILSIVCLPILGPVAWIMGNNALASGTVDPSQTGQVTAGRICGMVGTGLMVLGIIYWIVIFAFVGTGALHPPATP